MPTRFVSAGVVLLLLSLCLACRSPEEEASSIYNQGVAYDEAKDYGRAVKCYRKAADMGHAGAMNNLGTMYAEGHGVEKDEKEAAEWYRKGADKGNDGATYNLARCYLEGEGVKKDTAEGEVLLEKAAVRGNFEAIRLRAMKRSSAEAEARRRQKADEGDVDATYDLANAYASGLDHKLDRKKAAELYRKAADKGHVKSMTSLGDTYLSGLGAEKDEKEALRWYKKAADLGDERAKKRVKELEGK